KARAEALFRQAFALFQEGEFEAAALGFTQGLEIDPADGIGHFYLAETLVRQDRAGDAVRHYERTLALAPESKEALLARTRLPEVKAFAKWLGKWRTLDGSTYEIKLSGKSLTMVWAKPTPKMAEYGFRPGEERLSGSLKGSSLEGREIDRWTTPEARRCFGDRDEKPMSATLSADGRVITAKTTRGKVNFNTRTCAIDSSSEEPLAIKFIRVDK
ncbi:MAG: hypothetical protein HYZ11_13770, partial [Candidatus Tectomicrobia bacterium]|nr:hypothetical protein [Candidatus Tectomicrobia bacterium]